MSCEWIEEWKQLMLTSNFKRAKKNVRRVLHIRWAFVINFVKCSRKLMMISIEDHQRHHQHKLSIDVYGDVLDRSSSLFHHSRTNMGWNAEIYDYRVGMAYIDKLLLVKRGMIGEMSQCSNRYDSIFINESFDSTWDDKYLMFFYLPIFKGLHAP